MWRNVRLGCFPEADDDVFSLVSSSSSLMRLNDLSTE
jgi:hypothetical protein